tara:strand:+ start:268 stop:1128 length:861 start_codon:yes stop_codon:yes gene_type:complete
MKMLKFTITLYSEIYTMPEGPETKRMVDTISRDLVNKKIISTKFYHKSLVSFPKTGLAVKEVVSKGKAVVIRLNNNYSIITHNQLYGRWTSSRLATKIRHNRSLRIEFCTEKKAIRLWSATDISVFKTIDENHHPYIKNLGPDVLDITTTPELIFSRLISDKFKNRQFSGLLLNQRFISGLGNYLRSEILFYSNCMYDDKSSKLNTSQNKLLATNIKDVSMRAYNQKGNTIFYDDLMLKKLDKTIKNRRFMVFARKGHACYICENTIIKDQASSRRIYYCPQCQKA